jgi:hypothetical protein
MLHAPTRTVNAFWGVCVVHVPLYLLNLHERQLSRILQVSGGLSLDREPVSCYIDDHSSEQVCLA